MQGETPLRFHLTVKDPFMKACGSQMNLYVPFLRVTVNVFVPMADTEVFTLTPGPVRWKLWMLDLSATTMLTLPACVGFFAIVIVKPGPTVPLYTGVAARAGSAAASAVASAAARTILFIPLLVCGLTRPNSCRVAACCRTAGASQLDDAALGGRPEERVDRAHLTDRVLPA